MDHAKKKKNVDFFKHKIECIYIQKYPIDQKSK